MAKNIFITGVSSGIGQKLTQDLLAQGHRVFGTFRPSHSPEKIHGLFGNSINFVGIPMDVADENSIHTGLQVFQKQFQNQTLDVLIHNAGYVESGPLTELPLKNWRKQFDVNFFSIIQITQTLFPLFTSQGKILGISSTSAHVGFPFIGPYCSSKHAVRGLFESLRREMVLLGIQVIQISPGPVKTPIWQKALKAAFFEPQNPTFAKAMKLFRPFAENSESRGIPVAKLSAGILSILDKKNPKHEYFFVSSPLSSFYLQKWLPTRIIDKAIVKKLS